MCISVSGVFYLGPLPDAPFNCLQVSVQSIYILEVITKERQANSSLSTRTPITEMRLTTLAIQILSPVSIILHFCHDYVTHSGINLWSLQYNIYLSKLKRRDAWRSKVVLRDTMACFTINSGTVYFTATAYMKTAHTIYTYL